MKGMECVKVNEVTFLVTPSCLTAGSCIKVRLWTMVFRVSLVSREIVAKRDRQDYRA